MPNFVNVWTHAASGIAVQCQELRQGTYEVASIATTDVRLQCGPFGGEEQYLPLLQATITRGGNQHNVWVRHDDLDLLHALAAPR